MDYYEFYKELYHKENDRRQEVINSMTLPLAVITALAAAVYVLITSFPYSFHHNCSICFAILIGIASIALVGSMFFLGWAFVDFTKRYEYQGIAYPGSLYDFTSNIL